MKNSRASISSSQDPKVVIRIIFGWTKRFRSKKSLAEALTLKVKLALTLAIDVLAEL